MGSSCLLFSEQTNKLTPPCSTMADAEAILKVCDIYDWDGKGELDLFYLGDIAYALGFNVTKKVCVAQGQTDEEGKKFAKLMKLSPRSRLPLPPLTPRAPMLTTLSC